MENYIGKFVFVQQVKTGDTSHDSDYYDGEWIVLKQSAFTIYCVRPKCGYGFQDIKQMELIGDRRYNVIDVAEDKDRAIDVGNSNLQWAQNFLDPNNKRQRQWAEFVYYEVFDNAKALLRAMKVDLPKPVEIIMPQKTTVEIELLLKVNGTLIKVGTLNERLGTDIPNTP